MTVKKLLFCFLLSLFLIHTIFPMWMNRNFEEFSNAAADIYIKICNIDIKDDSLGVLKVLPQLIKEFLILGKSNNIDELFYFFVLSKRYYVKENFCSESWFLEVIILWSLTEMFLQDIYYCLKFYFVKAIQSVALIDISLFSILFERCCDVSGPNVKRFFPIKTDHYFYILSRGFFSIKTICWNLKCKKFSVFKEVQETILEVIFRKVFIALDFNLNVTPQEINEIKGLLCV